jgi:hypothetical protein
VTRTSRDGLVWEQSYVDTFFRPGKVTYGDSGFVLGGSTILRSVDGITWQNADSAPPVIVSAVAFGNGVYVGGGFGTLIYSNDGLSWSRAEVGQPFAFLSDIAFGNGTFVGVGNGYTMSFFGNDTFVAVGAALGIPIERPIGRSVLTSRNGSTWVESVAATATPSIEEEPVGAVTFDGARFVAVGGWAGSSCQVSTDGSNWLGRKASPASSGLAFADGLYVSVGFDPLEGKGTVALSADGWEWTRQQSPTTRALSGITHGDGKWVAVGAEGTILTSTNAVQWSPVSSGTVQALNRVAYGEHTFVALGDGGTILLSQDGLAWSNAPSGLLSKLRGLAYGKGGFVAVGEAGTILTRPEQGFFSVDTDPVKSPKCFYRATLVY